MTTMAKLSHMIVFFTAAMSAVVGAYDVLLGAYYGLEANNLPPPWKVVQLCLKHNIRRVQLEEPNLDVFQAFRGTGIDLSFSIPNDMLPNMATNNSAVEEWFNTYVKPFTDSFTINYIVVGDRALPGLDDSILPVMKSLQNLLNANYLGQVKVTTFVGYKSVLAVKDLPSSSTFSPNIAETMRGILQFLSGEGSPLMISIDPYQKYFYSGTISLDYATFGKATPVHDGTLTYYNLFDEMVDAFYVAIDKAKVGNVAIVVGQIGWPTCGNANIATTSLAAKFNQNFKSHIVSGKGTPKKQNVYMEGFIHSIFNENQKPEGEPRCYGIFNVDSTPIYPLF